VIRSKEEGRNQAQQTDSQIVVTGKHNRNSNHPA
jgi:hypothetical protein